jgi:hypothetical protein
MTMTAAAADLQKALFGALAGDAALVSALGGPKVFDHAPANVAFPYVTFGRTSVYDWSTGTESGTEQLLTLHVWSKARGKKETLDIIECIRAALDQAPLALDDHHLVNLRLEYSEARYDEDIDVHHGLLRFRAVTEDVG